MSSIKIKNFGPIKEGFSDNDGFLPIDKLMLFIGGQGSGKSSIVKLISTLTWLEKEVYKKGLNITGTAEDFKSKWCKYQSIHNYFKSNTHIEYKGEYILLTYSNKGFEIRTLNDSNYTLPKITYIPAERNFLSILEDLENAKGLPESLSWMLAEYIKARRSLSGSIPININNIRFSYNDSNKTAYISGENFQDLKLSEASSGIQSVAPMMTVLKHLSIYFKSPEYGVIEKLSFIEREKLISLMKEIKIEPNDEAFKKATNKLVKKFFPQYLFTIIEEIEQNLFPESQKNILFKMLEFNNDKEDNHLVLTTHSPYIIAYTTLAMKAFKVKDKANGNPELLEKIETIVPIKSCINPNSTGIYQIDDKGNIVSIKSERGLILDNNFLNTSLEDTNDLFNDLLDIEDECRK